MLNDVNIDSDAMIKGRWFNIGNSEFLVAHVSSPAFVEAVTRCGATITVSQLCKAMSEFLLLDWKQVKNIDGSWLEYTPENSYIAIVSNVQLREFVESVSNDISKFQG